MNTHLDGLNDAQLKAVQHPPDIPLQILAGPGSGKTKVLTTRIVHLITHHELPPESICAVTFTNKAANEMKERMTRLLGNEAVGKIKMGTFHALCAQFLRRYAALVGVENNFTVCDADESKKIVKSILKIYKEYLQTRNITITEGTAMSLISKAKAKGLQPVDILNDAWKDAPRKGKAKAKVDLSIDEDELNGDLDGLTTPQVIDYLVGQIYARYERILQDNNSLDFDDLLVYGVKLFGENPRVVKWCKHVLVDEFQDTNTMQYELMRRLASASRCVTIVGDPDQSIYGWRSAEVGNLAKMRIDFSATEEILLEDNYRSTAAILDLSVAIVSQDTKRIQKTLRTTHPSGPKPSLCSFSHDHVEASSIAGEIKRIIACAGGLLSYNDVVILLRYNALSRVFESALQKEGIPNKMLGGHRFFDRVEVKDVLAYLQLVDNPQFEPAFTRVVNVPSRGIGPKAVSEIISAATKKKISPLELVERIYDGKMPDIKPPIKRKVGDFALTIKTLRKAAKEHEGPSDLIRRLLELVKYEDHLKKTQEDFESRWQNVQELINFASQMENDLPSFDGTGGSQDSEEDEKAKEKDDWMDTGEDEYDEEELDDLGFVEVKPNEPNKATVVPENPTADTPLRAFLQASMLNTDRTEEDAEKAKERVTITTCHGAKGLEWPVVFIPVVEKGVFPSSRAEDIAEERRLLYVACTRAQGLLYLTCSGSRMMNGERMNKEPSEFVKAILDKKPPYFSHIQPPITFVEISILAKVLGRAEPDKAEVAKRKARYENSKGESTWEFATSYSNSTFQYGKASNSEYSNHPQPGRPESEQPSSATFVSARASLSITRVNTVETNPSDEMPLSPSREANKQPQQSDRGPVGKSKSVTSKIEKGQQSLELFLAGSKPNSKSLVVQNAQSPQTGDTRRPAYPATSSKAVSAQPRLHPLLQSRTKISGTTPRTTPAVVPPPYHANVPPTPSASVIQGLPTKQTCTIQTTATVKLAGGKRRLGMGSRTSGYPNKRFKAPE